MSITLIEAVAANPEIGFTPVDTTEIQEESVVRFMAALGYEPVYSYLNLVGFFQPKYFRIGKARISVNTAIRLHNNLSEEAFLNVTRNTRQSRVGFHNYISNSDKRTDEIIALFAGTCKIVKFVSATFNRKTKKFVVHNHNVKFMTNFDRRQHGF